MLEVEGLKKFYLKGKIQALDGVSFTLHKGKTVGVLGESGSGKTTLAKIVAGFIAPDGGRILFQERDPRNIQMIFQNPFLSLDPKMTVREILEEPFQLQPHLCAETSRAKASRGLLARVGLPDNLLPRTPSELSGGECQRVAIARAIGARPSILVCDEPVSSLDVLVRAQILNLLLQLQQDSGLSLIFISHDVLAVRHMSDDVLIMKEGKVCESGPRDQVLKNPRHDYTRALLAAR